MPSNYGKNASPLKPSGKRHQEQEIPILFLDDWEEKQSQIAREN